jgi:hypothetical protein
MAPLRPLVDGFYRSPRLRDMGVELPTRAYSLAHTCESDRRPTRARHQLRDHFKDRYGDP